MSIRIFIFIFGILLFSTNVVAAGTTQERAAVAKNYGALIKKLKKQDTIRVIVKPKNISTLLSKSNKKLNKKSARVKDFSSSMKRQGLSPHKMLTRSGHLVYKVNKKQLDKLLDSSMAAAVFEDELHAPTLAESVPLTNADQTQSLSISGAGAAVAILDTGVDNTHIDFGGRIVAEACFSTTSGNRSTSLCPNGAAVQIGPGSGDDCVPNANGCDHGTHVAGIAAGRNGIAPQANIIAVQVFSRFNQAADCSNGFAPCVRAYGSDIIEALEWVRQISAQQNVAAVNLSLGSGEFSGTCTTSLYTEAVSDLRQAGVSVVISAGNSGFTNAIGSPACVSGAVVVGASSKSDVVASFSNSHTKVGLFAPGVSIRSSRAPTGTTFKSGTSMAAPHVAGAIAALASMDLYDDLPATIRRASLEHAITNNGTLLTDSKSQLQRPRLDAFAAYGAITAAAGSHSVPLTSSATISAFGDSYELHWPNSIYAPALNYSNSSSLVILETKNGSVSHVFTGHYLSDNDVVVSGKTSGSYTYTYMICGQLHPRGGGCTARQTGITVVVP